MPNQQSNGYGQAAAALTALYVWAQQTLMAGVARIMRRTSPTMVGQAAAARQVRQLGREVAQRLAQETGPLIREAVSDAVSASLPPSPPSEPPVASGGPLEPFDFGQSHGERAAAAIRADLVSELADVRYRLTRLDDDIYKTIAPQSAIDQVLGHGLTPQQAQAAAWREFTRQGVTGFTDKSGRRWSMSAYVEMAVRTAVTRAFNASRIAQIQAEGGNLVTVTDDGHPCPLCQPWQNQVLSIVPDGVHPSTADAIAAGLMHPNCKHTFIKVTDPATLPEPTPWTSQDADRYKATQRQRALELAIRQAKQQLEYATDAEGRQQARQDVRAAQARMRDFLNGNPNQVIRHPRREQLNLSMR